jgi:D-aminopeptidase
MPLPTKTIRQIEASLARAVGGSDSEPGVAVGIAQGGKMVWGGGRGLANLKSQQVFGTNTPFRICSISKQFCCALVMHEVAAGRVDLSAHPSRYVPWARVLDGQLTIAHMMQNKSGIRDQWVMAMFMGARAEQRFTLADGVTAVKHAPASMWTPGSQNLYCNANFELLGQVLQSVTGKHFSELLQTHILAPLKMHDTSVGIDTAEAIAGDTRGYRHIDGAWVEEENRVHWAASAGMVSTIEDLLKWAACLRNPKAAGLPWVEDITRAIPFNDGTPATYACGINHAINAVGNSKREMLAHAGALRGWRSTLMHFVAEDTSIAVFMNRTNSPSGKLPRGVAMEILEALKIPPIWQSTKAPRKRVSLAGAGLNAGVYVSREQGLMIQLRDHKGAAEVFSHLDWSALCAGEDAKTIATEDGGMKMRVDSPAELTLTMRDDNVCTVMQRIKPSRPASGPFKSGGRFICAPIKSSAEVFVNQQGTVELAFTGIFGEGVSYPLTVVCDEVAWFDLSRGVDESPPGRVLVSFDAVNNALELSCMLARRIVFRGAS